jgi:AraC-like DNA-binding protein
MPRVAGVVEHTPSAHLRPQVAAIQIIDSDGSPVSVLPSSAAVLGIQFAGRVRAEDGLLSVAGITGLQARARRYEYLGATSSVMVRFTPQGASALGVPVDALTERSVPLDAVLPAAVVRETVEQISEAVDDRARVQVVERLLERLPWAPDPVVAHALRVLDHEAGSVSALAKELGLSERQLERRFRARVGVSLRQYGSLRRFERVVALSKRTRSLTELALEAGYYDQSHFIRDFRRFAGAAPGAVLR